MPGGDPDDGYGRHADAWNAWWWMDMGMGGMPMPGMPGGDPAMMGMGGMPMPGMPGMDMGMGGMPMPGMPGGDPG